MTLTELRLNIANGLRDIEVHSHGAIKSRKVFDNRMAALTGMLESIEEGLKEFPVTELVELKYRIKHSIRIMELADVIGVVSEP